MGLVIAVYTKEAFKEYIMPAVSNADHFIVLDRNYFRLQEDIRINLEVLNDIWRIKPDKELRIYAGNREIREKTELKGNEILQVLTGDGKRFTLMVRKSEVTFCAYRKYDISQLGRITIGEGEHNLIRFSYQRVISKEHAEIIRRGREYQIVCRGQNGLYINSRYTSGTERLCFGDYINIYSLHMVFLGNILAVDTASVDAVVNDKYLPPYVEAEPKKPADSDEEAAPQPVRMVFHRSPRIIEKIEQDPVEIEEPPKEMKSQKKPLLMTIGPSFTMAIPMLLGALLMIASARATGSSSGLFMYSGLVMALSSATVGVIWAVLNLRYQRKLEAETETHRYEAYSSYLVNKTEEIKEKYSHNQMAMNRMYPDAQTCLTYNGDSTMLWNRNATHGDFLSHRLGIGDTDFQVPIQIPKERFRMERDELAEKPEFISQNYKTLTHVPILLNLLEHRLVGFVGGKNKSGAVWTAKLLAAQIAACNCYTDVKMVFIYDGENSDDRGQWDFAKWLPHVWSSDRRTRYIAANKLEAGEVFYDLTGLFRQRQENAAGSHGEGPVVPKPYFVMFLSDPSLIEEELIARYVFNPSPEIGLSTVMLSADSENLPNACEYIVQNDAVFQGLYNVSAQKEDRIKVEFDPIDTGRLDVFSRKLSNLEVQELETGGEIPSSVTFFDMYGIARPEDLKAEERWLKNRIYDNIRGLIGQKAGGAPCYMDVHEKYHGPHGLVAGTTGSGKSETLQTYLLSLAINYSPDDVGFFIIDYKGGGMAGLFDGLPHMIGQISNLSGNQVLRAMVSIKSENRRRQRIFKENGVNNINSYTKLYKNKEASVPVPHLFIIIDEFAELKREEPDFMKELISVAQVGRSLGVHLILATQKPGGTVDDNIWSNTKFRLCLRVQSRQDSNDMLHKPDAAYITQAGRCYLQVGDDEVFELFQSGFSGAVYDPSLEGGKTELARLLTMNGHAEQTGGHARAVQKERILHQWIEALIACWEKTPAGSPDSGEGQPRDAIKTQGALEAFYGQIEAAGLDFARSSYNSARLQDFLQIYRAAKEMDGDPAANVIRIAASVKAKLPEPKEHTQLDAVKDYLARTAAENGYQQSHKLWLPILPGKIYLDGFAEYREAAFTGDGWKAPGEEWSLTIPVGMLDDPQNQAQFPLILSFSEGGHHAVIGSVVSGKSTLIQTILFGLVTKYTPEYLNVYGLDFSSKMMSAFEGLAHFGGIMYEGDDDKIAKFFNMIGRILAERKKIFRGGNYSQYVQVHGIKYPAIVIAIDNFAAFQEKTGGVYEKTILQLSKEGVSHGIFLLLSAGGFGMTEIPNKIAENLKTVLCLELQDKYAYADMLHITRIQVMPEAGVKGRGLARYGSQILEYQAALALEATDDYQRMEQIAEICGQMNRAWTGRRAQPVPEIPEKPTWEIFTELDDVKQAAETDNLLPVGYNSTNAEVYSIDLSQIFCYLIAGAVRTGKRNFMKVMIESARLKKATVCLIDGSRVLSQYSGMQDISYVPDAETMFTYFKETLTPEFKRRNKIKQQILARGGEEEELYASTRKEKPYFLFIADMAWFIKTVHDPANAKENSKAFLQTLFTRGRWHNIYFVGLLGLEDKTAVNAYPLFSSFIGDRAGIHFGGNVSKDSFLSFDYLPYKEQVKVEKPGIGQLSEMNGECPVPKIVVPLVNRKKSPV